MSWNQVLPAALAGLAAGIIVTVLALAVLSLRPDPPALRLTCEPIQLDGRQRLLCD